MTDKTEPKVVRSEHQINKWMLPTNDGKGIHLACETGSKVIMFSFGGVSVNFDLVSAKALMGMFHEATVVATPPNVD